jgi:hypothetical protein
MPDGPAVFIDQRARDLAFDANTGVEALRAVLIEREKNDERRWTEERTNDERRWAEARRFLETIQNSYRDGFVTLREETSRSVTDLRDNLAERQDEHEHSDDQIHAQLQSRMWQAAWGLIGFLGICVISLIGVVWTLIPHH